ncbi:alpha/beta hydrolase [Flavihumibacter sp. UBA7668]|uniref:alpha/beta hydrolase n=1 Tax=Flavihumibacter sp. UBA7668 TaxID=1946542 RepID=UPI0025C2AC7A|nr:alpha/beta hydrolase [Flavihumibacter sp. UBA7668]
MSYLNQPFVLPFKGQEIYYRIFGSGHKWVLALHGYGETGSVFRALASELDKEYRFICPDLPLHGQTNWHLKQALHPADLLDLVQEFRKIHGINALILAGYSMGGRLVSCLVQMDPASIHELWLFASDGYHKNPWYWLATQTKLGNRLFKSTMTQPAWFLKSMKIARFLRILHPAIHKFALQFLEKEKSRTDLYNRWTFYRLFKTDKQQLRKALVKHKITIRQYFGEFDRIIPAAHGKWIQTKLPEQSETKIFKCGHRLLDPSIAPNIAAALKNPVQPAPNLSI